MRNVRRFFNPKLLVLGAMGIAFSMLNGQPAQALTTSFNLDVTANVVNSCSITTSAVAFLTNYDVTSASPNTGTGSVTINCTNGAPVYITLGEGANPASGSSAAAPLRQMASGADRLGYDLYQDPLMTTVWGNTAGTAVNAVGTGAADVHTVYGSIPAGQLVASGAYADGVLATVNY
jgi:spore coat protein U-like protein